jgi:hypothetical protein
MRLLCVQAAKATSVMVRFDFEIDGVIPSVAVPQA